MNIYRIISRIYFHELVLRHHLHFFNNSLEEEAIVEATFLLSCARKLGNFAT
jgi:hypothetical protein